MALYPGMVSWFLYLCGVSMIFRYRKVRPKINPALSEELGLEASEDIVLRLPATGLVPSGSLFVTKNYTVGLRLSYEGLVPVDSGGNINLKNEQVLPFNVFVRRSDLAEALNVGERLTWY